MSLPPNNKPTKMSRELAMLSGDLLPLYERDKKTKAARLAATAQGVATAQPSQGGPTVSPAIDSDSDDDIPIAQMKNQSNRATALNSAVGGDIAAVHGDQENNNNNNNNDTNGGFVPFCSPEPPKSKGKHSFEAIPPINVLLPIDVLKGTFEKIMTCPAIDCPSKEDDSQNYHPLEVEYYVYGFATEVYISCNCCGWGTAICPQQSESKGDTPNKSPSKKKKKPERDSEQFHRYGINYAAGYLMQKLGVGMRGLDMILAFMGIAPSHGSDKKWNRLKNRIGLANHQVADEVLEENRKREVELTKEKADEKVLEWLQSEEGKQATPQSADAKRNEILKIKNGKVGITASGDAGWQKRKIGKNGGESLTGHNLAVGSYSEKIVAAQSYSQKCRIHQLAKKLGIEPREHRCPLNFDPKISSKAMEPVGAVQHCIDIANSVHNCYVDGFVMDDDSTTRANLKHSYADIIERDHPGTMANGKIPGRLKRKYGWPVRASPDELDDNGRFITDGTLPDLLTDYGRIPIGIPVPTVFWSDPQHRVRSVGGAFFDCRVKNAKATTKTDEGLITEECNNAKRNFGYFLKRNQGYSQEDFCNKAECVLLHLFNKHDKCDVYWCSHLKAKARIAEEAASVARARNVGETNGNRTTSSTDNNTNTATDDFICTPAEVTTNGNSEFTSNNNRSSSSGEEDSDNETDSGGETDYDKPVEDLAKYRSTTTKEEKKLYERVRDKVMPLLTPEKMKQVHHPFQTQKNEALQKQMTALCPKDRFFGGTNQLHDRVRLLVVLDSLGEFQGLNRLYHSLGLPPLNNVLGLWAVNKDNKDGYMQQYRKKPEIKKKRAGDKIKAWKEGMRKNKRAKTSGMTYESGIANKMNDVVGSVGKKRAGGGKKKGKKSA